jgi:O-antigen ligase
MALSTDLRDVTNTDTTIAGWRENAVYAILFSLPIAGPSVPHWTGVSFTVLVLLGLPELFRMRWGLAREEQILVGILVAYFVVFALSDLANGWDYLKTRNVGIETRFLLASAVLLLLRRTPHAGTWLLRGGVAGGFVVCLQTLFDIYVRQEVRASGVLNPSVLGSYAALLAMFNLVFWHMVPNRPALRYLIGASAAAAFAALPLTGTRGSYVGLVGMLFVWTLGRFRGQRLAAALAVSAAVLTVTYVALHEIRQQIDVTGSQSYGAVRGDGEMPISGSLYSAKLRIEMWRVSLLIFRDNPIWGVGRGNYVEAAKKYVDQGKAPPDVITYPLPHSVYFEALVARGIPGLIVVLALLLYPLSYFASGLRRSPDTALLGTLLVVGIALFSLTDTMTFLRNNFASLFLIYLCTFFTMHQRKLSREGY